MGFVHVFNFSDTNVVLDILTDAAKALRVVSDMCSGTMAHYGRLACGAPCTVPILVAPIGSVQ